MKIRRITTTQSQLNHLDEVVRSFVSRIQEYDVHGRILLEQELSASGKIEIEFRYVYDIHDQLVEQSEYNHGKFIEKSEYEYEEDKTLKSVKVTFSDGGSITKTYQYFELGRTDSGTALNDDGSLYHKEVAKLDTDNRPIEETVTNDLGVVEEITKYQYFEDSDLLTYRRVEQPIYECYSETFFYYQDGQLIREVENNEEFQPLSETRFSYQNGLETHAISRFFADDSLAEEKYYYDEKEQLIRVEKYTNEMLTFSNQISYNNQGTVLQEIVRSNYGEFGPSYDRYDNQVEYWEESAIVKD
ncbi:hypothetical protein KFE98_15035 [bacterium SCSIO 12741]|nr:hypothetical protein KFE98_15035 [bacterium SCSIO 12741]